MRIAFLLFSVLAVSALAIAAPGDAYSFQDPALDASPPPANAWADLTGGTVEVVNASELRASLTLSILPEMRAGVAYGFVFTDGHKQWYAAAVCAPELVYFVGDWENETPTSADDTTGSYTTGPGAVVTIDVPRALFGNATTLLAPRGLTADATTQALPFSVGLPILFLDEGKGDGTLALPPRANATANTTVQTAGAPANATASSTVAPAAVASPATPTRATPLAPMAALGALAVAALALRRSR